MSQSTSGAQVISEMIVHETLPNRKVTGHKGTFGRSLLIAGSDEMPGSVALSAIGAIRSGTGRLVVATTEAALPIVTAHVPEATFIKNGLEKIAAGDIPNDIAAAGIGPGLVDEDLTEQALEQLFQLDIPLVIDASALNKRNSWQAKGPVILTPHPGEFSRMTGYSTTDINQNRIEYSRAYAEEHDIIVVLKGKHTVIAFPNGTTYVNPTGNTALSKAGTGDVLTGMMTSFLATHKRVEYAVVNAVYIHGLCADIWAEKRSEATMTASDFAQLLPLALARIESEIYSK